MDEEIGYRLWVIEMGNKLLIVEDYGNKEICELQTAYDLDYITEDQLDAIRPQFVNVAKMLSGLHKSLKNKLDDQ